MRKLLNTLLFFILSGVINAQTLPLVEEFDFSTPWSFTNGAGIQSYPFTSEFYATFNLNSEPYLNSSEITIESPTYSFDSCSYLVLTFPLSGVIESTDTLSLDYFDNEWVTITKFTGFYFNPMAVFNTPSTATKFRFNLKTDTSKIKFYPLSLNPDSAITYPDSLRPIEVDESTSYVAGRPLTLQVYYYDIAYFKIECGTSLPITLISFKGTPMEDYNLIEWITASELNNDFFILQKSLDANNFISIGMIDGGGNSNTTLNYDYIDSTPNQITYYKLTQVDFNGLREDSEMIVVLRNNGDEHLKVSKIYNLLGQEVNENYTGVKIYVFEDGSVIKRYSIQQN